MTFILEEMITSSGNKKSEEQLNGRYLEIIKFPDQDGPGRGKYFVDGKIRSVFSFSGGKKGFFNAKQQNGRPFRLEPVVDERSEPIGFNWTMPGEYPHFQCKFRLSTSGAAGRAIQEPKLTAQESSDTTFG